MKWLKILLTGILVDLFYFPVFFTFFPSQISKNILAVVGLVFAVFFFVKKGKAEFPRELLMLMLLAGLVSIISLISITYNQTPDNTYVSYVISASIWLSSSFAVCCVIRSVHGYIDIPIIIKYLTVVCVFQCFSAMAIQFIPSFSAFVDRYFMVGQTAMRDLGRIYGIGAALDVGGSRFAAVLIGICYMMQHTDSENNLVLLILWVLSFAVITVIGNMIARTTLIGVVLGILCLLILKVYNNGDPERPKSGKLITAWLLSLGAVIPICFSLYQTTPLFKELLRFGFEGFFSFFEEGTWMVGSNETLKSMIVWPEELRTWIVGDGYFANSRNDPNYLGDATVEGFYMNTDIGYLRFIFYFGVPGLLAMSAVILWSCYFCCHYFEKDIILFVFIALANFVIWGKVSTDLFLVFCPFMAAAMLNLDFPPEEEEDAEDAEGPPEELETCESSTA